MFSPYYWNSRNTPMNYIIEQFIDRSAVNKIDRLQESELYQGRFDKLSIRLLHYFFHAVNQNV